MKRYIKIVGITTFACLLVIVILFFVALSGLLGNTSRDLANGALGKTVKFMSDLDESGLSKEEIMSQRYNKYSSAISPMKFCLSDSMCGAIPDGPCACSSAGKNTGINRMFSFLAKAIHVKIYHGTVCASAFSDDISCFSPPICQNFRCTIDTTNSEVCEKSQNADQCLYKFALHQNDSELCKSIEVDKPSHNKLDCIMQVAVNTGDVLLCGQLEGIEKTECEDDFYYRHARDVDDYKLCLEITETELEQKCLARVIRQGDNTDACELLTSDRERVGCIAEILKQKAKAEDNLEICNEIPPFAEDTSARDNCLQLFN